MYSTRSSVVAVAQSSSDSLAHSTTGVRSIGALLVSDELTQATSTDFQVFPSHHTVTAAKIVTSTDTRGYIPVLEYTLREQTIMIDTETRMCHWTGIWKALGKSKADVVRLIESQPDIAGRIRKIRGGHLKAQGTWMPYEIAQELCRRVAWDIRHDLVPLFGPTFPDSCIAPGQPGFGKPVLTSPDNLSRSSSRDPKAREAAQKAARAAQNNKWVDTARQAKGFVAVGENQPEPEPEEMEQPEELEAVEEAVETREDAKVASQSPALKTTYRMEEKQETEGKDENEAPTATPELESTKAAPRSAKRVRTTSGNWYAGGGIVPVRGIQGVATAAPISTRYAPYRFSAAPPLFAYSPLPFAYPPPPAAYPPTSSAYPHAMFLASPYNPTHLHPSHAHLLPPRHAPLPPHALARAPSVPNLQLPHAPAFASPFNAAPHFSGGAPIRRTVSDPQAQSWEFQPASADAEGGRLALGVGVGLFAESGLRSMPEAVEMAGYRGAGREGSTMATESQESAGFAAGSAGSLRLPPIARVEQRSNRPASFTSSTDAPILPPISHLRGYEAHPSLGSGRPHPPRPTLITQEDLLSHAARTTRSHPNYSSDPHRHLTAPSSPIAPSPTSPLSAASSQGSLIFQPQSQGQTPSPLTPVTQQCHQNEQQLGHLLLLERWAGEPTAESETGAF